MLVLSCNICYEVYSKIAASKNLHKMSAARKVCYTFCTFQSDMANMNDHLSTLWCNKTLRSERRTKKAHFNNKTQIIQFMAYCCESCISKQILLLKLPSRIKIINIFLSISIWKKYIVVHILFTNALKTDVKEYNKFFVLLWNISGYY